MPVLLDSASHTIGVIAGSATTATLTQPHAINPSAPSPSALVFGFLQANNDVSAATITAKFGGVAMNDLLSAPLTWGSKANRLVAFGLQQSLPTGPQSWEIDVSGLTASGSNWDFMGACLTHSGVLAIGTPVVVSGDTAGASTNNTVTVPSVSPAYKVVTAHACTEPDTFSNYNLTAQAITSGVYSFIAYWLNLGFFGDYLPYTAYATGGELLVGDAPGAATVTGTAVQPSTALYGAIGIPLVPSPVVINAALTVPVNVGTVSASLTRITTPSPLRTWVIGGTNL